MQRSVFAGWVAGLDERGFDLPFLHLLRVNGFFDIRFTHGAYEFGKDFVAKRDESGIRIQYAIQSKSGDIGTSDWNELFSQLHEASRPTFAHPGFDAAAPRHVLLVTTGRLKGKTIQSARDFEQMLNEKHIRFSVWDAEFLTEMMRGAVPDFPTFELPPAIEKTGAEIALGSFSLRSLALGLESSVEVIPFTQEHAIHQSLASTLIMSALRRRGNLCHSVYVAAHLARIAAASQQSSTTVAAYEEAMVMFDGLVFEILKLLRLPPFGSQCVRDAAIDGIASWISYPASCAVVAELLSICLIRSKMGKSRLPYAQLSESLGHVVRCDPGIKHPPSDRYAVSLFFTIAALVASDQSDVAGELVADATVWLCDRFDDDGIGLAGPYADVDDEVSYLLGAPLASVGPLPRRNSMLAVVLADASMRWFPILYRDVINDIQAVRAIPKCVIPVEFQRSLFLRSGGTKYLLNPQYPYDPQTMPWHRAETCAGAQTANVDACMAAAVLCRDRLFQGAVMSAVDELKSRPS